MNCSKLQISFQKDASHLPGLILTNSNLSLKGHFKSAQIKSQLKAIFTKEKPASKTPTALRAVDAFGTGELNTYYILAKPDTFCSEKFRNLGSNFFKSISCDSYKSFGIDVDQMNEKEVLAFCEGLFLSDYNFNIHKKTKTETVNVTFFGKLSASLTKKIKEAKDLCDSVLFARYLGDQPGNKMTPSLLAKEAEKALKPFKKVKVQSWDLKKIKAHKMGGLAGVAQGSAEEPRFIVMEYKGGAASKKPLCLVGKGLTFDAGGISIKPGRGMEDMKYDKCGGCAVIATMVALAKLNVKANVIGIVPSSENLLGSAAIKPGDILTAYNGTTVEVNNTDAEGRLILMDALSYVSKNYKPKAIVDVATLTGAMVVALGNIYTGVFARDKNLEKTILKASKASGEKMWAMPLDEEFSKDMKGIYADLSNLSHSMGGGSATAAAFLENFVDKQIPWAHLDIAGTAWHTGGRLPYTPRKGASGVMVRTFVELAKSF